MDDLPPSLVTGEETAPVKEKVDDDQKKVPITVVTGYLGSGKSTLLNYVATQREKKIAIILNEFGDSADIERSLTVQEGGDNKEEKIYEEWLELDNGCLCCTVKDSGVVAIEKLMEKRGKFDYILLETTGIADPGPIASMFWLDDALASTIYLDGIVCVLDAESVIERLDDNHEGNELTTTSVQISHADVILLNKCDRIKDNKELDHIKNRIRGINALATIVETTYSRVPSLSTILDLGAYDGTTIDEEKLREHSHGYHDSRITTVSKTFPTVTKEQQERVERWLQNVLWEKELSGHPVDVHRTKGRLVRKEDGRVSVIQGVRETYEIIDTPDVVQSADEQYSKIVMIGKGLSQQILDDGFRW